METFITSRGTSIIVHRPELNDAERNELMCSLMDATERLLKKVDENEKKSKKRSH